MKVKVAMIVFLLLLLAGCGLSIPAGSNEGFPNAKCPYCEHKFKIPKVHFKDSYDVWYRCPKCRRAYTANTLLDCYKPGYFIINR